MFNKNYFNIILCLVIASSFSNKNTSFASQYDNDLMAPISSSISNNNNNVAQEIKGRKESNSGYTSSYENINKQNLRRLGRGSGQDRGSGGDTGVNAGAGAGAGGNENENKNGNNKENGNGNGNENGNGDNFGRSDEMGIIQNLIDNRNDISRTVLDLGNGVFQAETTSDRLEVAEWIKEHVTQMTELVEAGGVIRQWDPLFVSMFENINDVQVGGLLTDDGVIVTLEGLTACGMSLAEAHTRLVSEFIAIGRDEVQSAHPILPECL